MKLDQIAFLHSLLRVDQLFYLDRHEILTTILRNTLLSKKLNGGLDVSKQMLVFHIC